MKLKINPGSGYRFYFSILLRYMRTEEREAPLSHLFVLLCLFTGFSEGSDGGRTEGNQ